ncbi:MAG: alpha/beta hydrolase fold protein [Frankiales bacterium]|nr:alpha/beta hydrolase fold protein [Frankiales bacterium]
MTIVTQPTQPTQPMHASPESPVQPPARRGPLGRIIVGSIATGFLGAVALTVAAFPGSPEHVTTGLILLSFAAGWAMLAFLSRRMTDQPQQWARVPAVAMAAVGVALIAVAPDNSAMTAATWVWPPLLIGLAGWSATQVRASVAGRRRWLVYPVLGVLSLTSVGAFATNISSATDGSTSAMPGATYDVGGYRLHINCTGTGSPTVVLFNGLGETSPIWSRITTQVSRTTRVCTYDRAGQGWSEDAPHPQDSTDVARDLHTLLDRAGITGPVVLAGHSIGGVYALAYAAQYPQNVDGMALLDSTSPYQFTAIPAYASQYQMMRGVYGSAQVVARVAGPFIPATAAVTDLPEPARSQEAAFSASARGARTARDELSRFHEAFTQAQALTTFGNRPLAVVTSTESASTTAGWTEAQNRMASLSTRSTHIVVDETHARLLSHEAAAEVSADAIINVAKDVRASAV